MHRAVIGQGKGRHAQLGRPRGQVLDPAEAVKKRVFGVDVQMDERHGWEVVEMIPASRSYIESSRLRPAYAGAEPAAFDELLRYTC